MRKGKDEREMLDLFKGVLEAELNTKEKKGFFTFRHFRRNPGSVTAFCVVHRNVDGSFDINVGFSFCNPSDQFSKREGRKQAMARFLKKPIRISDQKGISNSLMAYLRNHGAEIIKEMEEGFHRTKKNFTSFSQWFPTFLNEL